MPRGCSLAELPGFLRVHKAAGVRCPLGHRAGLPPIWRVRGSLCPAKPVLLRAGGTDAFQRPEHLCKELKGAHCSPFSRGHRSLLGCGAVRGKLGAGCCLRGCAGKFPSGGQREWDRQDEGVTAPR